MFAMGQHADEGGGPRLARERGTIVTVIAVIGLSIVAWVAVIADAMRAGATSMDSSSSTMGDMSMGASSGASSAPAALAFLIAWGVMMAAMMLPSAAPMIGLYGAIQRSADQTGQGGVATGLFALVYVLAWLLFGAPVYGVQVAVNMLVDATPALGGLLPYAVAVVLAVAGAYQLSPLKIACLRACRSPLGFLMARWRAGYLGAVRLALAHALYCIGCCWALMVVLVAAGAMGLHWVLLIAALVAAEKLAPGGVVVARVAGVALLVLATVLAINPGIVVALRGTMS
jgi:predicted metal-binding membrane protein